MNPELASNFILLMTYLLPGFLAAWVFYGLTSHPKPTQFERVIQALVFTFVIQTFIPLLKWTLEGIGRVFAVAPWDKSAESIASFVLALMLGAFLAHMANADKFHKMLRAVNFTSRTSHPSEWYAVLAEKVTYVVLHLKDGRRLFGWPKEWPIQSDTGQFYIMEPSWIDEDGANIDLDDLDGVLVHAANVEWVEFLRPQQKETS